MTRIYKLSRRLTHILHSPTFWVCIAITFASIASNLTAEDTEEQRETTATQAPETKLLREGTRLESRIAECRSSGDRMSVLLQDDGRVLNTLENLASQRILKAVMDDPGDNKWVISGTVTEFQGHNFLLLERVNRVSK